ncbi:MAG: aldo/keto reductase [Bacilli bacterium]|nr:aldo/keto reductase [Bacilli bacterium]
MKNIRLNNGYEIPEIGLGTFRLTPDEAEHAVEFALKSGYRHIDTANVYMNEKAVGRGIKKSGVPREEIFLTSKVFPGYFKKIPQVVQDTLKRLDVEYLDLFLLHQPYGDIQKAWQDLEKEVEAGRIRSIGVSNFSEKDIDKLLTYAKIKPVLNQVECHPYHHQDALREHHQKLGIEIEAWYPLGSMNKDLMNEPLWEELSKKYNKSKVQIILRWHLQKGNILIPGTRKEDHILANKDIYDFELTQEEMDLIAQMDKGKKFLGWPHFLGKILIPMLRFNFDKQK